MDRVAIVGVGNTSFKARHMNKTLPRLAYEAVQWRDYPVIQGVVLMVSAITLLTNLLVDILYGYLDPRIRYG